VSAEASAPFVRKVAEKPVKVADCHVDPHRLENFIRLVSPIVADPTDVVSRLADVLVDSTPSLAADLIEHDGGLGPTARIAVLCSIIRAERGLERRKRRTR